MTAAIHRLAAQAKARDVVVDLDLPAGLPQFEADAELLGVALEHVIDLAIARSAKGRVRVSCAPPAEGPLVLQVEDSGGAVNDPVRGGRDDQNIVGRRIDHQKALDGLAVWGGLYWHCCSQRHINGPLAQGVLGCAGD